MSDASLGRAIDRSATAIRRLAELHAKTASGRRRHQSRFTAVAAASFIAIIIFNAVGVSAIGVGDPPGSKGDFFRRREGETSAREILGIA